MRFLLGGWRRCRAGCATCPPLAAQGFSLHPSPPAGINYANEKLQSLFNHHVFVMESDLYRMEGVDVSSVTFTNNLACIELIEAKGFGLLPALDELCTLGREGTTDADYLEKIDKVRRVLCAGAG